MPAVLQRDRDPHSRLVGVSLCGIVLLAAALSGAAPVVVWLAVGLAGAVLLAALYALIRPPVLALFVLGFIAISQHAGERVPIVDLGYAASFFVYLGYCFAKVAFTQRPIGRPELADVAVAAFFGCLVVGLVVSVVLGGETVLALKEASGVAFFFAYLPARLMDYRDNRSVKHLIAALTLVTFVLAVMNFREYVVGYFDSEFLWQIAVNRVTTNEHWFMMLGPGYLVLYAMGKKRLISYVGAALYTVTALAVIIGQSRAVWVAFAIGTFVALFLLGRRERRRAVRLLAAVVSVALVILVVLYWELVKLVVVGLVYRFGTISGATQTDLSLINRFQEGASVLQAFLNSPLIGHGFGVEYAYYSLVYEVTHETSFVHNTVLAVAYHFGVFGLVVLAVIVSRIAQLSVRLARTHSSTMARAVGITVCCALVAELVSGLTEYSFGTSEKPFLIGILAGVVAGIATSDRPRRDA